MTTANNDPGGIDRRHFLRLAGLGGGALVASCTAAGGSQREGRTDLVFWLAGGSGTYFNAHKRIAKAYEKMTPGVAVTVRRHTGTQSFTEVLLSRIAAGNPPSATVLWDTPVSLGVRGSLAGLGELMEGSKNSQVKNWPKGVLASCQFEGETYGLPVTAGAYAMWYNQDWFEELGIPAGRDDFPKTWDDLRNLSKEFTLWKGDKLQRAGFIPPLFASAEALPIWSALNGGQIFDAENQRYTIDSEPNVEMMEYFVSWLDEEYRGDIQKVVNSASWGIYPGEAGQPPAFQNERLATMLEGSWVMGDLYEIEPKFENWNVAPIPVGPSGKESVGGYWPNWLTIPTGSNDPEAAFKYLDYMCVAGVQDWFAAVPDLPTNSKVPGGLAPSEVTEKRGKEFAVEVTDFFRHQLEVSTPMWNSPVQSFATDQLFRAVEQVANKQVTPRDALVEAQRACQAELESVLSE